MPQPTAKAWLSIPEAGFVVFRLPAFQPNLRKRLVRMAKLYCVDTGLTCWLLGIREPDQLRFHPLRGAVFVTWVVSEAIKHRANQGLAGGTYHYRDRSGTEVELVLESSRGVSLIEAKASTTASTRMLGPPMRVRSHLASAHPQAEVVAIYGGDDTQRRNDGSLIAWHGLNRTEPARDADSESARDDASSWT